MTPSANARKAASAADPVLAELVEELTMRLQAGQPVDLTECAREYPAYLEQLRELLPALQALAGAGSHAWRCLPKLRASSRSSVAYAWLAMPMLITASSHARSLS